tara:strand:- start:1933 stop:2472 length:540 start_codon:yes stop_codon:yes gene_type:complete
MKKLILLITTLLFVYSCGIIRPEEGAKVPVSGTERVKKNIEEGRGFRIGNLGKKGGDFLFSSSNPMWRASMDKLSFAPLSVVDYGGGIIITDWFSDSNSNEEIKIAVRFLSNEIRSDALKIIIHKKYCESYNKCKVTTIENSTNNEIKLAILKQAARIQKQDLKKTKKEVGDVILPKKF